MSTCVNNSSISQIGSRLDYELRAGNTWEFEFVFTDKLTGNPIDLTIYDEIHVQVRPKTGGDAVMEAKLSDADFTITGADDNVLNLLPLPITTTAGRYVYDIDFIAGTSKQTHVYGNIKVVDQTTQQ